MSSKLLVRGTAAASGLALTAGLLGLAPSHAAIDTNNAGQVLAWAAVAQDAPSLSAETQSNPMAKVVTAGTEAYFLTASGKVIVRSNDDRDRLPDGLAAQHIVAISTNALCNVAINEAGTPTFWGDTSAPTCTPGGVDVSNLVQVALGQNFGLGVKQDGTVVAWGVSTSLGITGMPAGLTNVAKVAVGSEHAYALRNDGSLVAWGLDGNSQVSGTPAALAEPGAVKDVAARFDGGLALLQDGTVASWGKAVTGRGSLFNKVPDSLTGKTITAITATGTSQNAVIDAEGGITLWGQDGTLPTNVPAGLDGRTLTGLALGEAEAGLGGYAFAIQRKVMPISASKVTGTAKQGSVLTGTPGTFSGEPTISYEWLANGAPIAGATGTTLTLTSAHVGKKIAFRTVATADDEVQTSDSPATATVAALAVASKTTIAKPKVKKKTVAITVKVTRSGGTPTGKVKITVKRGSKTVYNKSVTLKKGVAKITIKKLKKGKHKVSASYAGDSRSKPSSAKAQTFKIK
ncbi:Ig-like domain repeat protein [Nocardioides dubius]|uniref:Bacterial Ig-like domain-containing protein n=2 Tax=Nocardioides dubius TaxID=317019 RepID=A0ABN1U0P5_9ACTN